MVVSLGCLSCALFYIALRSKVLGNKITVAEWDMNIVTVDDYSVEFPISYQGYCEWYTNQFKKEGGDYHKNISPGLSFKRYLIHKIEK